MRNSVMVGIAFDFIITTIIGLAILAVWAIKSLRK